MRAFQGLFTYTSYLRFPFISKQQGGKQGTAFQSLTMYKKFNKEHIHSKAAYQSLIVCKKLNESTGRKTGRANSTNRKQSKV